MAIMFDPSKPANGSLISAAELRGQFNGLKTIVDNIPAGPPGLKGDKGDPGDAGPPGPAGEVTQAQLNAAINGTPRNVDGIVALSQTVSDPPTQAEVQAIQDKVNELIAGLRRNV